MADELYVFTLALVLACIMRWGFTALPAERWQIFASVPTKRNGDGSWRGLNFTYYGFFNASACVLAVSTMFILLRSVAVPTRGLFAVVIALLVVCVPAAKIVARLVEKKKHTLTVGGASFIGILAAPWIVSTTNATLGDTFVFEMNVVTFLAALTIAYALGEGTGRLACISFGCCYGKPLSESHPFFQNIFKNLCFTFSGKTKKAAYAGGLEGDKLIPIQAITSIIFSLSGVLGAYLFLKGYYVVAFLETLIMTQMWRSVSEALRADYRGEARISAYQVMSIGSICYSLAVLSFFPLPHQGTASDIILGLRSLWDPLMIIFLECLWAAIFLYTGRSMVTGATMSFHVFKERI